MSDFSREMIEEGNEIFNDNSLTNEDKYIELESVLYDWGYDLDDMFNFILALKK